ncbi:MAG: NAD-binding protein, partial [Alphaproteobacteria bacterium]|nr:NAD-binding protein [Alphaproteobacteria bacterium]
LHERFAAKGLHLLDAPVSGGPKGAVSGRLAIWVGGDREVFDRHRGVLDALGDQVRYIGAVGAGSVAKLVHNSAGYAVQCALAEVFTLGVKAGVDPLTLWAAVRQGARGRQRTFDSLADHFLINHYDPADFALKLAHKDVALAADLGRDVEVPLRFIELARAELAEALNRGWGERDSRVAMVLQQERAGVSIEVDGAKLRDVLDRD